MQSGNLCSTIKRRTIEFEIVLVEDILINEYLEIKQFCQLDTVKTLSPEPNSKIYRTKLCKEQATPSNTVL